MTTHRTSPLHISITYKMSGSTGPRANRSVEIDVLCTYTLSSSCLGLLLVCVCACVCVCVCERERERERESDRERERRSDGNVSFVFLHLRFPHKVATLLQNSSINSVCSRFPAHLTLCLAGIFIFSHSICYKLEVGHYK